MKPLQILGAPIWVAAYILLLVGAGVLALVALGKNLWENKNHVG